MKISILQQCAQKYYKDRPRMKEIITEKLMNSKVDVLLMETPIKKEDCWTDIFMISKDISEEVKKKVEKKRITVMDLMADDFLNRIAQGLTCFSTFAKAQKIKEIIEGA